MNRTYSELISIPTFEERLEYLRLHGQVGEDTFGYDRIFNQMFYTSREWRKLRNDIITRDAGCDLACPDHEIPDGVIILIHHLNPITLKDIQLGTDKLLDPENLITTIKSTHDAIHYGIRHTNELPIERSPNDMCPWKR